MSDTTQVIPASADSLRNNNRLRKINGSEIPFDSLCYKCNRRQRLGKDSIPEGAYCCPRHRIPLITDYTTLDDTVELVRYDHKKYQGVYDVTDINRIAETLPSFGIFKDNYFVTGSSFSGGQATKYNSDAKFQISIRQRLFKGVLPFNTSVFLSYSQKSFWDIYRESKPFDDNNYNPALGLNSYITLKKKVVGIVLLQYEHESNGRDSIWSRSVNKLSLTGILQVNKDLSVYLKIWYPHALDITNQDLTYYAGYATAGVCYQILKQRMSFSAYVTKRGGWNLNANVDLEAAFKLTRRSNQYICLKYYNGYAEGLLNYNKYSSYLRIGIVIKPRYFSVY